MYGVRRQMAEGARKAHRSIGRSSVGICGYTEAPCATQGPSHHVWREVSYTALAPPPDALEQDELVGVGALPCVAVVARRLLGEGNRVPGGKKEGAG